MRDSGVVSILLTEGALSLEALGGPSGVCGPRCGARQMRTLTAPSASTNQRRSMAWIWPSVSSLLAAWIFFITVSSSSSRRNRQ